VASKNSYTYYTRFLRCLKRYLEKFVDARKKEKHIENPEVWYHWLKKDGREKSIELSADIIYAAFESIFNKLIEKAPSACMGADDWLDKFLINAVYDVFCTETWRGNNHCENNMSSYPYNCKEGCLPSKCEKWKAWRFTWRSYPDNEVCQKCKHYKPEPNINPRYRTDLQTKQINEYKCYCRAKELPEGCLKKKKAK